ncbi:MAG: K(+)-transporting ATPase subunit F [Planctomycetes bacterium]|nr:K(+)-transporting ATPase subunit F [Planctomycetota bacterium]
MTILYSLAALLCVGLAVYLFVALFQPERFE